MDIVAWRSWSCWIIRSQFILLFVTERMVIVVLLMLLVVVMLTLF